VKHERVKGAVEAVGEIFDNLLIRMVKADPFPYKPNYYLNA
jgi:hypothetical protein